MSHDKEWQMVDGVETLVPVEQFDIDPVTDSSCVKIEGFRTLEETLNEKNMFTPEVNATKVMDKVGGEYHQNVVDGAYEEAILYGNTQVNLCEEDSSVALQIPTTFTSFNNGELKITNKENQVVAPLIKGVTMVNLAQTSSVSLASGESVTIENVKGNTLYTLSFKFTTKNTNSGVTIESYNGDTYLENTMHKTGLGDVAKFTFTTHANATVVKIVNNAAYGGQTIQLDDIMAIEGDQTGLDIPFFKGMKSVELVRPLTNLFANDTPTAHSFTNVTNNNGQVTATSQSSATWTYACFNITFKSNTSYIVMWDSLSYTQTGNANQTIAICYGNDIIANIDNNFTNKRSIIFNTGDKNPSDINLRIHATLNNTETGTTTVKGLRVFEYDDYLRSIDLQSIGWFSGTKNVAVEPIKTCGKNLYPYGDINFTPTSTGWFDAKGTNNMYGDIAQKSKCRFLLRKGTYKLSSDYYNRTNLGYMSLVTDKEEIIGDTTFTLDKDTYLTLRLQPVEANVPTTLTNIQIERGDTATAYVAHDSRYYEPDGQNTVVLRSLPSGVCDTFNLQTGEYTRRIGEAVLDGSDNGIVYTYHSNTTASEDTSLKTCRWFVQNNIEPVKNANDENDNTISICDKLKYSYVYYDEQDYEGFFISNKDNRIFFKTEKSKLNSLNTEGVKQYLQQNPITVQYELATPITTIIPRTIKRNNNGTTSTIDFKTYTNKESLTLPSNPSYLTINSMTSIKPVVEPITYIDFKTRLKANTDYSVIIDKDSINKTINLGGTAKTYADKMLVRTPSINLEQNLRISGGGSIQNIMVIEGDVLDKELPYFNGMCNVKMPIIRNCGKNLFDGLLEIGGLNHSTGEKTNSTDVKRSRNYINVKPNMQLSFTTNHGETGVNWFFYDANKKYISNTFSRVVTVPSGARYLKIYNLIGNIPFHDYRISIMETPSLTSHESYRSNDICIAQGEIGLSQDMFEQGTTAQYTANIGKTYQWMKENSTLSYDARRLRIKSLIKVEPNTKLILQNRDNFMYAMGGYGANKLSLGTFDTGWIQNTIITIPQDVHYISFAIRKKDDTNITINDFNQTNFKLLKLDEIINLRSLPNGVKDELNLLTGEYIQRVGEVVLDGSEDENWELNNTESTSTKRFAIGNFLIGSNVTNDWNGANKYVCDKLNKYLWSDTVEFGITVIDNSVFLYNNNIDYSIGALKTWLSQNPITVQYELAEPIISYPRIVSNTQEREVGVKLPNGVCDTYNPSTGVTVKRVGKVILDGSENWLIDAGYTPTANLIRLSIKQADKKLQYNNGDLVCDKLPVIQQGVVPCIYDRWNEYLYVDVTSSNIGVTFGTDDNATIISKFKTWLNANPITVYYELKNPVVTTDIVLPNGVHDGYNPITGLYTKRVGYMEFDGSNDERWSPTLGTGNSTHCYASISIDGTISPEMKHMADNDEVYIMSNSYETVARSNYSYDKEQMYVWSVRTVYLNILQSKLSTIDMAGFRTYLSQNPIKLWYELQTPQKIQLTPYFGLPMPYAYQGGHLIMDSAYDGVSLPPEFKYKLVANRTGQVNQNNIKLQQHTTRLSNLEAMLVDATLQSMYEREMMAFNLEMVNINLINLEE